MTASWDDLLEAFAAGVEATGESWNGETLAYDRPSADNHPAVWREFLHWCQPKYPAIAAEAREELGL